MPNTLTDKQGNTYRIFPSRWLKALTAIAVINFVILIVVVAFMIDNTKRIEETLTFTDKAAQRNAAVNEIAGSRATANIWAFHEACDYATKQGRTCLANPKWYADPEKYPLIVDDVMGAGLFPPKGDK